MLEHRCCILISPHENLKSFNVDLLSKDSFSWITPSDYVIEGARINCSSTVKSFADKYWEHSTFFNCCEFLSVAFCCTESLADI